MRIPANPQVPLNDVFQLNFKDFANIPLTFEQNVPVNVTPSGGLASSTEGSPVALDPNPHVISPTNDEWLDFSGFYTPPRRTLSAPNLSCIDEGLASEAGEQLDEEYDLMDITYPLYSTPSSILPGNFGNEVGTWEVNPELPEWSLSPVENSESPTASDVVSEYCVPARTASTPLTPRLSTPTNPCQLPQSNVSVLEPPPATPRITRARARRQEGIPVPEINYKDISDIDIGSNDATLLRNEICSREMPLEVPFPSFWPNMSSKLSVHVQTDHEHYHLYHTFQLIPKN